MNELAMSLSRPTDYREPSDSRVVTTQTTDNPDKKAIKALEALIKSDQKDRCVKMNAA